MEMEQMNGAKENGTAIDAKELFSQAAEQANGAPVEKSLPSVILLADKSSSEVLSAQPTSAEASSSEVLSAEPTSADTSSFEVLSDSMENATVASTAPSNTSGSSMEAVGKCEGEAPVRSIDCTTTASTAVSDASNGHTVITETEDKSASGEEVYRMMTEVIVPPPKPMREKKWWVCSRNSCRVRNPAENATCSMCSSHSKPADGSAPSQPKSAANGTRKAGSGRVKTVKGVTVSHVVSPTEVYLQTPQQVEDYGRVQKVLDHFYSDPSAQPQLVLKKMMLGMKHGSGFERVRTIDCDCADDFDPTVEIKLRENVKWLVRKVDVGGDVWVPETELMFLLRGLSDIPPQAEKFTLSEVQMRADVTTETFEKTKKWLEEKVASGVVDATMYMQSRDRDGYRYVDLRVDEELLNTSICDVGAVERKSRRRWHSTSSQDESFSPREAAAPPSIEEVKETEASVEAKEAAAAVVASAEAAQSGAAIGAEAPRAEQAKPAAVAGRRAGDRREGGRWRQGRNGRQGGNRGRGGNGNPRRLPQLSDWAVVCFDPLISQLGVRYLCSLLETAGVQPGGVKEHTAILMENTACGRSREDAITYLISSQPRLLLLLCVLPDGLDSYQHLEVAGRSLGVCVVCVRGEKVADLSKATAAALRRDMQSAMLDSPALLPNHPRNPRRPAPGTRPQPRASEPRAAPHQALGAVARRASDLLNMDSKKPDSDGHLADARKLMAQIQEMQSTNKSYSREAFGLAARFFSHLEASFSSD